MRLWVLAVALILLTSTTAEAQAWRAGSLAATGGTLLVEPVTVGNATPEIHFHIPNTDTTNSDDFIVPRNYLVRVSVNAHYESTGANGLALTLELYNDGFDASSANNHSTVENTILTGAGDFSFVWDVPAGKYYIDVADGPDAGTAVVTVSIQRVLLKK